MSADIQQRINELIDTRPGAELIAGAASFKQDSAIELSDGIYMSQGTSNAYMIVGKTQRLIINTGMGFEALTHKRLFDAVCDLPSSHIILTQGHVDHVGGVSHFKEPDTVLIAQALNPQCQADDARIAPLRQSQSYVWFSEVIDEALIVAKDHPEVFIQDNPKPDVLFDDNYCFDFDGEEIQVIAMHGGETLDSAVVYLPKRGIVFSGNTFGPLFPHFPNFNTIRGDKYRFFQDYIQALNKVRALKPQLLITGHGMPIEGADLIDASLERLESAVSYIHDKCLDKMNQGEPIDHIMQTLTLPEELRVGQGYGRVQWAIRTFWESYIGWFRLKSTTELLATPMSAVYADVLAISGIKPLLDKAKLYASSGELEKAMQLTELACANNDADAIQYNIDLHQQLLNREQDNFWFSGWIQQHIKNLQSQLQ